MIFASAMYGKELSNRVRILNIFDNQMVQRCRVASALRLFIPKLLDALSSRLNGVDVLHTVVTKMWCVLSAACRLPALDV